MEKELIGVYYPSDQIENQQTKTILCLLFDKIILHFPIAHTGCGGGVGVSSFFDDDPLVEAGVIELREELLLNEIEANFSPGNPWGTQYEFNRYYELNVTGMALQCSESEDAVPVTDQIHTPIPTSVLSLLDLKRSAGLQASILAMQTLSILLPQFSSLDSYSILEVRDVLKDQLVPFRNAMFALAPKVRTGISCDAPVTEVYAEAKYIVETDIAPRLADLRRRLELERGVFWRKIIQNISSQLPSIALKWVTKGGIASAVDAAKIAGGAISQAIDNEKLAYEMLANGGLGYLLSVECEINKTRSQRPSAEPLA